MTEILLTSEDGRQQIILVAGSDVQAIREFLCSTVKIVTVEEVF